MNFWFQEHLLVAAANRCKVLNIFGSKKFAVCIQGYDLRKNEMLTISNVNLNIPKLENMHVISNKKYSGIYSLTLPSSLLCIQQSFIQNPIKHLRQSFYSKLVNRFHSLSIPPKIFILDV